MLRALNIHKMDGWCAEFCFSFYFGCSWCNFCLCDAVRESVFHFFFRPLLSIAFSYATNKMLKLKTLKKKKWETKWLQTNSMSLNKEFLFLMESASLFFLCNSTIPQEWTFHFGNVREYLHCRVHREVTELKKTRKTIKNEEGKSLTCTFILFTFRKEFFFSLVFSFLIHFKFNAFITDLLYSAVHSGCLRLGRTIVIFFLFFSSFLLFLQCNFHLFVQRCSFPSSFSAQAFQIN